jgi:putative transposase
LSDAELKPVITETFEANYSVYGARKMWKALQRAGHDIGRDRTARLMRSLGLHGARRGKRLRTTRPDARGNRPADLVERRFDPTGPNRLWVLDITYVPTWSHVAYVCLIVDAFARRIVAWRVATNMQTDMVLDALEMAAWARGTQLDGLVATPMPAASQFTSIRFGERLAELGALASIGSVGDSYDCDAVAESFFATLQTELLDRHVWVDRKQLARAIFEWIECFYNPQRRHSTIAMVAPADYDSRRPDETAA